MSDETSVAKNQPRARRNREQWRAAGPPQSSRQARAEGYRDPLKAHRAVVGTDALTPWYIRVRSVIGLILLAVLLGALIAGVLLAAIASGRFVLELLAG